MGGGFKTRSTDDRFSRFSFGDRRQRQPFVKPSLTSFLPGIDQALLVLTGCSLETHFRDTYPSRIDISHPHLTEPFSMEDIR